MGPSGRSVSDPVNPPPDYELRLLSQMLPGSLRARASRVKVGLLARQERRRPGGAGTLVSIRRVITRLWRGWTALENADAYELFLLRDLFPSMRDIPGFCGADVLRCDADGEVAFVTLTRFENLEAIRAFAGEDYEIPVIEPTARALLSRHDGRAQHYETKPFRA